MAEADDTRIASARQRLLDLADRCERESPSKDLDSAIGYEIDATPKAKNVYKRGHYVNNKPVLISIEAVWPPYTTSLDAAVTLQPEDVWNVNITWSTAFGDWIVSMCGPDRKISQAKAKTEVSARVAASLRARAAEVE